MKIDYKIHLIWIHSEKPAASHAALLASYEANLPYSELLLFTHNHDRFTARYELPKGPFVSL